MKPFIISNRFKNEEEIFFSKLLNHTSPLVENSDSVKRNVFSITDPNERREKLRQAALARFQQTEIKSNQE